MIGGIIRFLVLRVAVRLMMVAAFILAVGYCVAQGFPK